MCTYEPLELNRRRFGIETFRIKNEELRIENWGWGSCEGNTSRRIPRSQFKILNSSFRKGLAFFV